MVNMAKTDTTQPAGTTQITPMKTQSAQHTPRKRFGQNFLQDQSVIQSIIDAVNPLAGETLIEIGPGLGALTKPLLARCGQLHVVEIDRDIIAKLRINFPDGMSIHEGDALTFDFNSIPGTKKIVGNLPYNISTPLLFHLADYSDQVIDMHFMLQKEVVERMVATPSTTDYGRLSVMLQYSFAMELLFIVPPQAFWPPPKVESAVVRMLPQPGRCGLAQNVELFAQLVKQAFAQRRKTLRNNLKNLVNQQQFDTVGIDPGQRAEDISVQQYVALSNLLNK